MNTTDPAHVPGDRAPAIVQAFLLHPALLAVLAVVNGIIAHVHGERGERSTGNAVSHAILAAGLFVAAALRAPRR